MASDPRDRHDSTGPQRRAPGIRCVLLNFPASVPRYRSNPYIPAMPDSPNSRPKRPVLLCILDGWGEAPASPRNAIALARTPNWDRFIATSPHALIDASEGHVGLPAGQMGNSEVGHMNLGAGRIVLQDLPRIDAAVADGTLASNGPLRALIERLKATGGTCHLMGLISPGGVHSHQDHVQALARILDQAGVEVAIHAFLDGRDTPPKSALDYLAQSRAAVAGLPRVRIATVIGRYYAMDRDKRWDRCERAWRAMVLGASENQAPNADAAIRTAYARGETDEFVPPTVIAGYDGMSDGDALLSANFRADRMRQIMTALLDPAFDGFARPKRPQFAAAAGMTEYSSALEPLMTAMFLAGRLTETLGV